MNPQEMCVIPQYNFEVCADVRKQYDAHAKERLCSWIKNKSDVAGGVFDYAEVRQQICDVKTQFPPEVQTYVLECYESSFARNVLVPEILSWPGSPNISLLAVLYTMPNDARPTHLLSAMFDADPSTGRPNGAIIAKRTAEHSGYAIPMSFKINNFMNPDRAEIEWS
ncbi:MAG: hypothetical protein LBF26_03080 [Puniceicoccales bacterium]|nr:hypothetical protein [Puniceicoccales bacterium]